MNFSNLLAVRLRIASLHLILVMFVLICHYRIGNGYDIVEITVRIAFFVDGLWLAYAI
jgi:hypothetical protein